MNSDVITDNVFDEWIKDCEKGGLNPYKEAMETATLAVCLGDNEHAKKMSTIAIEMIQRGYHKDEN